MENLSHTPAQIYDHRAMAVRTNLYEYQHDLNLQDNDTDHDGIDDGEELIYWNVTRGIPNATALSYLLTPDVDNDSVVTARR